MEQNQTYQRSSTRIPQPSEVTSKQKDDAMGAYLMMFATWFIGLPLPFLNLFASIIYYVVNKRNSRFVGFHAHQSLITQLPVTLMTAGLISWTIYILVMDHSFNQYFIGYAIATAGANLFYVVFSIIACVMAYKGKMYYIPLFGRLSYAKYFGPNAVKINENSEVNLPPSGK